MKSTITVEAVPNEMHYLDLSEKEYNRMISRQMMYHKVMMEDLMKLSTETETGSSNSSSLQVVAGLGNTVETMNATNTQLLNVANKKSIQGGMNAQTASTMGASIDETNANMRKDIMAYDALKQQEGFSNNDSNNSNNSNNSNMKAALDNSAVVLESQKYALALFGAFSIYLLYKTVKYL